MRTKHKTARLEQIDIPLGQLTMFMKSQGLGASPSLTKLWLKTKFYMVAKDVACCSKGFDAMLQAGLVDHVRELTPGDASSLELWFRTMIHEAWMDYLSAPTDPSDMTDQVLRLGVDADTLLQELSDRSHDWLGKVLRPVQEDVEVLATFMKLWQPEETLASKVEHALEHLETRRMGCFALKMTRCDIGCEAMSKAALIMQSTGQDHAGDAKFKGVQRLLADDRLPAVKVIDGAPALVHRQMVSDMRVVEVLSEALELLQQAMELWSRPRRNRMANDVKRCFASMVELARLTEECLQVHLLKELGKAGLDKLILESPEQPDQWDQEGASPLFMQLKDDFMGFMCFDEPLEQFLGQLKLCIASLPNDVNPRGEISASISDHIEPIISSGVARHQLEEVLRLMSEVLSHPDLSHTALFNEVKKGTSGFDLDNSRLTKAVKMQAEVDVLKGVSPLPMQFLGGCYFEDVGGGDEDLVHMEVWPETMQEVFQKLPEMIIHDMLDSVVTDCLGDVFAEFGATACLDSLKVPGDALPGASPVEHYLESCVQCTAAIAKPADMWLKSQSDETGWPSYSPMELAEAILVMFVARRKTACVSPLCVHAGAPPVCEDVHDLEALKYALRMFEAVGKIGRLLAWVRAHFKHPGAPPAVHNHSMSAQLEKALTTTKKYLDDAFAMVDGGAVAAVAGIGCLA